MYYKKKFNFNKCYRLNLYSQQQLTDNIITLSKLDQQKKCRNKR